MKAEFDKQIEQLLGVEKERKRLMTDDRYMELLAETKEAMKRRHNGVQLSGIHYRRLKRFEVTTTTGDDNSEERLVQKNEKGQSSEKLLFCMVSEMFDVVHKAHIETGHRKEKGMEMELKRKYCNITREVIAIYLNLCRECVLRKKQGKPKESKPTKKEEVVSQTQLPPPPSCKIDIIDMEAEPDGDYNYILIYQDHPSKFLILRPLHTRTTEEVAEVVFDIFCLFGRPSTMACNIDRRYCNEIQRILSDNWNVNLERVEFPHFSTNHVAKQIYKCLKEWMSDNETHNWAANLRIIQSLKNNIIHPALQRTPHEAMFGISKNDSVNIQTEEKLKEKLALLNQKLNEVNEIRKTLIEKRKAASGEPKTETEIVSAQKPLNKVHKRSLKRRMEQEATAQKCPTFNVGERVMVRMADVGTGNCPDQNDSKRRKCIGKKSAILERLFYRHESHQCGSQTSAQLLKENKLTGKSRTDTPKIKTTKLNRK